MRLAPNPAANPAAERVEGRAAERPFPASRNAAAPWPIRLRSGGTLALLGVLLVYGLLSVQRSGHKPIWFDELGTLNVASQPTLAQMFRVEPADGNPPLQYLLARASMKVFGTRALALRLPALFGMGMAIACAYVFVARRFGAAAGLLAALLLALGPMGDYGVEARPYGLLFGLTALLLVCWQRAAAASEPRRGSLAGLALTLFALLITHPMGFLWAGVPLLAGEFCRWMRTRRLDRAMLLALALGCTGFAITLAFGHRTEHVLVAMAAGRHPALALPTLRRLGVALRDEGLLPPLVLLPPAALCAGLTRRRKTSRGNEPLPRSAPLHEWAAVAALACTPLLAYLFTVLVTHYFWGRYIANGMLGWMLLLAMACGATGRRWAPGVALGLSLLLIWHERQLLTVQSMPWPRGASTAAMLGGSDPSQPILFANPSSFPEFWWYSPPALRARLHFLVDAPRAAATDDFIGDLTLLAMHRAGSPMFPPDSLEGFLPQHPRFLFWQPPLGPGDWLQAYLREQRYRFTPIAGGKAAGGTLYQVSAPAGAP